MKNKQSHQDRIQLSFHLNFFTNSCRELSKQQKINHMNQHLSAQKYFSKLKNENHNERQNKALFLVITGGTFRDVIKIFVIFIFDLIKSLIILTALIKAFSLK